MWGRVRQICGDRSAGTDSSSSSLNERKNFDFVVSIKLFYRVTLNCALKYTDGNTANGFKPLKSQLIFKLNFLNNNYKWDEYVCQRQRFIQTDQWTVWSVSQSDFLSNQQQRTKQRFNIMSRKMKMFTWQTEIREFLAFLYFLKNILNINFLSFDYPASDLQTHFIY